MYCTYICMYTVEYSEIVIVNILIYNNYYVKLYIRVDDSVH